MTRHLWTPPVYPHQFWDTIADDDDLSCYNYKDAGAPPPKVCPPVGTKGEAFNYLVAHISELLDDYNKALLVVKQALAKGELSRQLLENYKDARTKYCVYIANPEIECEEGKDFWVDKDDMNIDATVRSGFVVDVRVSAHVYEGRDQPASGHSISFTAIG